MKHLPFESIYREHFEVVEQRQGHFTFYPHHDQLPILWRALNLEFSGGLPARLARADQRAQPTDKLAIKAAALLFCTAINEARSDGLRLFPLLNRDLVTRIAIVQQTTESTPRGPSHRFRFYGGPDFFPEIYLSGKRLAFADHVLQRFSDRVPHHLGADLALFLLAFFGGRVVSLPVGPGPALMVSYFKSLLALTFKESKDEFFLTTCLTINEINSLGLELPPRALNFHYDQPFTRPKVRHWMPSDRVLDLYSRWENKVPLPPPRPPMVKKQWHRMAHWVRDNELKEGHGPGTRLCFVDHIPGPHLMVIRPDRSEPRCDELEIYKKSHPDLDWDTLFAERYGEVLVRPEAGPPPPDNPAPTTPT